MASAELRELNEANFVRLNAKLGQFKSEIFGAFAEQSAMIERRLGEQTRFLYLAWATILAAVIGFGLR